MYSNKLNSIMSYFPYGTPPTPQSPFVQQNPVGFVAPVARSPFESIIRTYGVTSALSALSGSSSSASGVKIVTYESVYGKDYVKDILKLSAQDIENGGQPMALKYDGCDVLIPIPTKSSILKTAKKSYEDLGTNLDDKDSKNRASKALTAELWVAHKAKCGHDEREQTEKCVPGLGNPANGAEYNSSTATKTRLGLSSNNSNP